MSRVTSTPRQTAGRHHLAALIGQTVTVKLLTDPLPGDMQPTPDPRHVQVIVLNCATPYGAARLLVAPVTGSGQAWISADKLISWPGSDDTTQEVTEP